MGAWVCFLLDWPVVHEGRLWWLWALGMPNEVMPDMRYNLWPFGLHNV